MTLYDLDLYALFKWRGDVFQLESIDEHGTAQAPRIATLINGNWRPTKPLMNNNFNAYTDVEQVELTVAIVVKGE